MSFKKESKKSSEILSLTSAAVQALSTTVNKKPENIDFSSNERNNKRIEVFEANSCSSNGSSSATDLHEDQRDVLALGVDTSSSSPTSQSAERKNRAENNLDTSSLDSMFDRSTAERVRIPPRLLREIKNPQDRTAGSVQRDLQQPAALVIRHVGEPSAWVSASTPIPLLDDVLRTPPVTQAKVFTDGHVSPTKSQVSMIQAEQLAGKSGGDDEQVINPSTFILKKSLMHSGLCQGVPMSAGGISTNTLNSDSTKIKRFCLTERERALKEEFMKRKDVKSAPVKRLVQPTIIAAKENSVSSSNPNIAVQDSSVVRAAAIAAAAASAATAPSLQIQHGLESQISALVGSINALHEKQSRLEHQKVGEQEDRLQEQLGTRLKKLEELQKQMLELQRSQTNTHTITTTVGAQNPHYVPAAQQFTQRTCQTQTSSATQTSTATCIQDASTKFKLVKNTKTQTSPSDSSLLFDDSPLQTPLPRKRPPLPMSRNALLRSHGAKELQYQNFGEKRVHFSDHYHPASRMASQTSKSVSNPKSHVMQNWTNPCFQTSLPQRAVQEMEKCQSHATREIDGNLSRLNKQMERILTETEKIKDNLNLQKIKGEINGRFTQMNKGPSPLDAYLSASENPRPADKILTERLEDTAAVQHYADAERILKNVQMKRNNLESNLDAIVRQSDAEHLYYTVDCMTQQAHGVETLKIRKDVDKIIKEMSLAVKKEIEVECKSNEVQSQSTTATKQPKPKNLSGNVMSKNQLRKPAGKENVADSKTNSKKAKIVQPVSKAVGKPVPKPAAVLTQPETYLTSIYGRQSHHPRRTTSKAPYLHYRSPVNPKTAALTSAILRAGSPVCNQETPKPIQIRSGEDVERNETQHFYFHPDMDMSSVLPSGEVRGNLEMPVKGHLVPMAIPLGKPKTDQSLRLPLTTVTTSVLDKESTPAQPSAGRIKVSTCSKPNVALITIHDEKIGDESTFDKEKKKKTKTKKHPDLEVQILPHMDIDSFTDSSDIGTPPKPLDPNLDTSKLVTRPDNSDYEDFKNYLAVRDTETRLEEKKDEDEDDVPQIPFPENHITVKGHTEKDYLYHGPPFPPQHPPSSSNVLPGVVDAENRMSKAMEDKAVEWVEQELLARIVSEMNEPLPDPTVVVRTPPVTSPDSSTVTDDGYMLAATLGFDGIQLFVDAGIPVDRELVASLIRDVIAEQIVSTLGYPKPTASTRSSQEVQTEVEQPEAITTPVSTPLPTPVYTPVESESSEQHSPPIATPDPSSISSESSDTVESEGVHTPDEVLSETEVLEARSPVPTLVETPVATPTGSHSTTASMTTPLPSTHEPETELGSSVPTPETTERTPSAPPESCTISTPPVETSSVFTPKPPSVASSPSSMTTSTLSTPGTTSTMTTIDEELSEGQLLQPYVHMGQYSEGEYTAAFSPGVERNISDEALGLMGKDQGSRNHLIRVALNGLLGPRFGSSSSTVSSASTMKDSDDIREDSLGVYTRSEGEIVLPGDQVPVSHELRITRPESISSEGELVSTHRTRGTSPGEFRPVLETDTMHSPGEITTRPNLPHPQEPESPENTESRSLHTSDLQHKKRIGTRQLGSNGVGTLILSGKIKEPQNDDKGHLQHDAEKSTKEKSKEIKGRESRPLPIHVPIPSMEESSLNSEGRLVDEQEDTYGDVSSITDGDF